MAVSRSARVLPDPAGASIKALFDLAASAKSLVLRKANKGRSTESASVAPLYGVIYQPTNDDRIWARYYMASQLGAGAVTCCCRPIRITKSDLYLGTVQLPQSVGVGEDANFTSGAQSYAPAVTIEAPGAGRTEVSGTWSNSATGTQTPIGRLSTTAGGQVRYTITGARRLLWRGRGNATNGGLCSVVITESGVEITSAQYEAPLVGASRIVNEQLITSVIATPNTKMAYMPLARDLDSTKTYVVTLTQTTNRIYDHGLVGYLDADDRLGYPFDQVGYTGTWDRYSSFFALTGNNYAGSYYAGSRKVYLTGSCTRIYWKHARRVNGAYAAIRIYDASGNNMNLATYGVGLTLHATGEYYLDTYATSSTEFQTLIADALPLGTYYVHIWSLGDRSVAFTETAGLSQATGSKWAIYDGGLQTVNTAVAGTYPTDAFIDSDQQYGGGGSDPLDAAGNCLFAGQARFAADGTLNSDVSNASFVTGTHGAETYPSSVVVRVDGAVIDYAGAALNTEWQGSVIEFEFDTQAGTQGQPTNYWANLHYLYRWTAAEFRQKLIIRTIQDIYVGTWYACITQDAGNSSATNGTMLGAGFDRIVIDLVGTSQVILSGAAAAGDNDYAYRHADCLMSDAALYGYVTRQYRPWSAFGVSGTQTRKKQYPTRSKVYPIIFNDSTSGGNGTLLGSGYTAVMDYGSRYLYTTALAGI